MNNYTEVLKKSKLFHNMSENDIEKMLLCLNSSVKSYKKGSYIYNSGDKMRGLNLVLKGSVHIIKEDYWGNISILTEIAQGELFGETYACLDNVCLQVSVCAAEDCTIMELDIKSIISTCNNNCSFHLKLIENLLFVMADKNFMLTNKMEAVSQRSIRNKVMTYLSQQSDKQKSSSFNIPFNRQQLADYLAVDRSALSKELSKLRDEGLIDFNKSRFKLKEAENIE